MVYEPREDSHLLAQTVSKYAQGLVLDMGTGSGIQAITAQNNPNVTTVLAADIDKQALTQASKQGVQTIHTDLFSHITDTYDTIISNTPYLPNEPLAADIALDGGVKGYEWTIEFLRQAKKHLGANGQILMLISTRTNPNVIQEEATKLAYEWTIVNTKKISFEKLLVYRITHALPKHPQATYLARGKRSKVYLVDKEVIKKCDPRRIAQEAQMLLQVNKHNIGPRYVSHDTNTIRMQYVQGERIDEYLTTHTRQEITKVLKEVLEQMKQLDELGINKAEMNNPYKHIIIDEQDKPVLIDWERAKHSLRVQNTNQFHEYLKKIGYEELISQPSL